MSKPNIEENIDRLLANQEKTRSILGKHTIIFNRLSDGQDELRQEISALKERMSALEERVSALEERMSALEERMSALERTSEDNNRLLRAILQTVESIAARVAISDEYSAARLDALEQISDKHTEFFAGMKQDRHNHPIRRDAVWANRTLRRISTDCWPTKK